jgi:hypothetical protein
VKPTGKQVQPGSGLDTKNAQANQIYGVKANAPVPKTQSGQRNHQQLEHQQAASKNYLSQDNGES